MGFNGGIGVYLFKIYVSLIIYIIIFILFLGEDMGIEEFYLELRDVGIIWGFLGYVSLIFLGILIFI